MRLGRRQRHPVDGPGVVGLVDELDPRARVVNAFRQRTVEHARNERAAGAVSGVFIHRFRAG